MPSTTWPISATASSAVVPRAMSSPARRLRPSLLQQVTMRSPMPARPANVSTRAPPPGPASPSRHAARDHAGLRVVAEAEAVDAAGGERDDVLRRAAELDADDVGVHVDAERRRVDRLLEPDGERLVLARDDRGRRQPGRDLLGEVRAGEARDGPALDERREPLRRVRVEALREAEHRAVARAARARRRRRRCSARRRRRDPRRRPARRRSSCAVMRSSRAGGR